MDWKKDTEIFQKMSEEYKKVKYKCSCGHSIIIPSWVDKQLCSWCNKYVYKNKQDEFKDRLKSAIRRK